MRKLKHLMVLTLTVLLIIGAYTCVSAAEPEFNVTKTQATVINAPENSSMAVALYDGNSFSDMRIYKGSGTITANYADDMSNALDESDNIKVFLWDFEKIYPLTAAYCNKLTDLTDKSVNRVLTVYFSATGNTKSLAEKTAEESGSDIFEIVPEEPYTSEDLNYSNSNCRANKEQNDPSARPAISNKIENIYDYDVILIGYPIWWGTMPKIINTFLDTYDLSGKTIMPFCTSGSSGISTSVSAIRNICTNSTVTDGFRGTSSTAGTQIRTWLNNNNFSEAIHMRMKLTANGKEIIIKLNNNDTAKDLAATLPCELDFSDFGGSEKIAYPPQILSTVNTASGTQPNAGDLTLYKPWGNLALFYKDYSYSSDLIPLGSIEKGTENISMLDGKVKAELL